MGWSEQVSARRRGEVTRIAVGGTPPQDVESLEAGVAMARFTKVADNDTISLLTDDYCCAKSSSPFRVDELSSAQPADRRQVVFTLRGTRPAKRQTPVTTSHLAAGDRHTCECREPWGPASGLESAAADTQKVQAILCSVGIQPVQSLLGGKIQGKE
ncbi:hypothetical protein BaRGS_00018082, partial [Batillaria attramentaria]